MLVKVEITFHVLLFFSLTFDARAAGDAYFDGMVAAVRDVFDVADPGAVASGIATDPLVRPGTAGGSAAESFASLLKDLKPRKIEELAKEARKRLRGDLGEGERDFFSHLRVAGSEALKLIDGKRKPATDPRDEFAPFKNAFADAFSVAIDKELPDLRAERRREREEEEEKSRGARRKTPEPTPPPSKPVIHKEAGFSPHRKEPAKRRPPALEETRASREWAKGSKLTPRQVEDWLVDLNTEGDSTEAVTARITAAEKLLGAFSDPSRKDDIVDRATSKDKAKKDRWEEFGLKDSGFEALRQAKDIRAEADVEKLRDSAFSADPSAPATIAARREIVRRVNADAKADPLGALVRDDFHAIRPDRLLDFQAGLSAAEPAAGTLAELLGGLNTQQLRDLASKGSRGGNEAAARYARWASCAANLALEKRELQPESRNACAGLDEFAKRFGEAFGEILSRNKSFTEWLARAGNPEELAAARDWMFSEDKGGYTKEELMDYLANQVLTAKDPRVPAEERERAREKAVNLAKLLGTRDEKTGDWILNLATKDAGHRPEEGKSGNVTLVLGGDEEIFAAIDRFSRRDTDTHPFSSAIDFGTRSRFQSFVPSELPPDRHLADTGLTILYAPADRESALGVGSVADGSVTTLGKRSTWTPAGIFRGTASSRHAEPGAGREPTAPKSAGTGGESR